MNDSKIQDEDLCLRQDQDFIDAVAERVLGKLNSCSVNATAGSPLSGAIKAFEQVAARAVRDHLPG